MTHVRIGGSGPAIVLIHGFGESGDMWAPLAARLVRTHAVIVPDLRGMGRSSKPATGFSKMSQASDLAALMDIARIEAQIARAMSDVEDLSNRTILERELAAEQDALAGLDRRKDRLVLKAPAAGLVVDVAPDIHPGRWLNGSGTLARVVTPGRYDVLAYVGSPVTPSRRRRAGSSSTRRGKPDRPAFPRRGPGGGQGKLA